MKLFCKNFGQFCIFLLISYSSLSSSELPPLPDKPVEETPANQDSTHFLDKMKEFIWPKNKQEVQPTKTDVPTPENKPAEENSNPINNEPKPETELKPAFSEPATNPNITSEDLPPAESAGNDSLSIETKPEPLPSIETKPEPLPAIETKPESGLPSGESKKKEPLEIFDQDFNLDNIPNHAYDEEKKVIKNGNTTRPNKLELPQISIEPEPKINEQITLPVSPNLQEPKLEQEHKVIKEENSQPRPIVHDPKQEKKLDPAIDTKKTYDNKENIAPNNSSNLKQPDQAEKDNNPTTPSSEKAPMPSLKEDDKSIIPPEPINPLIISPSDNKQITPNIQDNIINKPSKEPVISIDKNDLQKPTNNNDEGKDKKIPVEPTNTLPTSELPNNKKIEEKDDFVEKESIMLQLHDDDVVLGELTDEAMLDMLDFDDYIKLFWDSFLDKDEQLRKAEIKQFLEDYDNKFYGYGILPYISKDLRRNPQIEPPLDEEDLRKQVFEAARKGDLNALRAWIDNYPALNIYDADGNNLLAIAVQQNNYNLAEYLLKKGIEYNNKNIYNESALDIARKHNYINIIQLLHKADIDRKSSKFKY